MNGWVSIDDARCARGMSVVKIMTSKTIKKKKKLCSMSYFLFPVYFAIRILPTTTLYIVGAHPVLTIHTVFFSYKSYKDQTPFHISNDGQVPAIGGGVYFV
jgi:hypothetical protein